MKEAGETSIWDPTGSWTNLRDDMPRIIEAGEGSEDRTGRNDEEVLEEAEEPSDLRMVGAAGSGRVASMTSCQPFSVLYTHVRHFNETYLM